MESTTNSNTQTLIKMLEQMKQAYLNELRRNIELEQLNKQLRQLNNLTNNFSYNPCIISGF